MKRYERPHLVKGLFNPLPTFTQSPWKHEQRNVEGEYDLRFYENQTSIFSRVCATLYVTMSVRRSVGPSVITARSYHTAPAHPHTTDAAVYTALFTKKELRTPT